QPLVGPLGEGNFAHEFRSHPCHPSGLSTRRRDFEGTLGDRSRFELRLELFERLVREAGPYPAAVGKSLAIVHPQQERTEPGACPRRFGKPTNHKLLAL